MIENYQFDHLTLIQSVILKDSLKRRAKQFAKKHGEEVYTWDY